MDARSVEPDPPGSAAIEDTTHTPALLADTTCVRIVLALHEIGELPIDHLADIEKTPRTVSQHLNRLHAAQIVTRREAGQRAFHRLAGSDAFHLVLDAVDGPAPEPSLAMRGPEQSAGQESTDD